MAAVVAVTAAAVSRRERKKQATRDAIHDAAFTLAEEAGVARLTVEAIAERADVAPRTFFNHFPSKEEAVLGWDPDRAAALARALTARPASEDALDALGQVLADDLVARVADTERALRRIRLVRAEPALRAALAAGYEAIERALAAAVATRADYGHPAELYPALVVSAACGACRVALLEWSHRGGAVPLRDLVTEALGRLGTGLADPCSPRPAPASVRATGPRERTTT